MGLSYFKDGGWQEVAVGATGKVLQVSSTVLDTTFTAGSVAGGGFADVTGLTVTITPANVSSKILILAQLNGTTSNGSVAGLPVRIIRDGTYIAQPGGTVGNRISATFGSYWASGTYADGVTQNGMYVDAPATTSAVTYGLQIGNQNPSARDLYVNRSTSDSNDVYRGRYISTLTCIEVGP